MINFPCSSFTWKSRPHTPDPYFKYSGGFVGDPGQAYQVRFNLEAACEIRDESTDHVAELFVGAPCRTEYTIARRNLFQVPSSEFRFAFSRERMPAYMRIRELEFAELPKTISGKIRRVELRAHAAGDEKGEFAYSEADFPELKA